MDYIKINHILNFELFSLNLNIIWIVSANYTCISFNILFNCIKNACL